MENLDKAIVLMNKIKHTCMLSVLYFMFAKSPMSIGNN